MHSTNQVLMFVFVMTTIVAVGLTGLREATKPLADANEAIFNKKGVFGLSVFFYCLCDSYR